jgi:hypothetical protein
MPLFQSSKYLCSVVDSAYSYRGAINQEVFLSGKLKKGYSFHRIYQSESLRKSNEIYEKLF